MLFLDGFTDSFSENYLWDHQAKFFYRKTSDDEIDSDVEVDSDDEVYSDEYNKFKADWAVMEFDDEDSAGIFLDRSQNVCRWRPRTFDAHRGLYTTR